ncbi:DUF6602 domain-containing protein [Pseudonocardia sp. CA-142604]|uniref:DUF6602 domain-containing protein n=1 Tax=Pseudonocardia sp. CA-142604 TaxID=3240024 RepID=UPI003D8C4B16
MPEPSLLASILAAAARRMRSDFDDSSLIHHNASKGTVREGDLLEFLKKYLPDTVRAAGSSEIISADGQVSGQTDIVIYDPSAPPLFSRSGYRILPIECVYGVIEVKSRLTAAELTKSIDSIARLKRMPKTSYFEEPFTKITQIYGRTYNGYSPVFGFVFAYDSGDLMTMSDAFIRRLRLQPYDERIDAVWVLGKGSYTWTDPKLIVPHMHAAEGLHLAVARPEESVDVLMNMVLTISTLMSRSHMSPFNLTPYAANDPLWDGATVRGPVDYQAFPAG